MLELKGNHKPQVLRHVDELEAHGFFYCMKKLLWTVFVLIVILIFIGLVSCIQTGDEDRPGMQINTDLILTKVWEVDLFKDDGSDKTILFSDVYIEFRPNFVFRVTKGCEIVEGEWILSADSTLLVIRLPDGVEPLNQLDDEWVITWLTDSEMRFIEQDDKGDEEFHLSTTPLSALNCQSCDSFIEVITDSVWSITTLTAGINDVTEETRGSYLKFRKNGEVILYSDYSEMVGLWAITDHCQILEVQWLKDQLPDELYQRLENSWFIRQIDLQFISLESEEDAVLHLTKGRLPDCEGLYTSMLNTSWAIDYMAINEDNVSDNFKGTGFTFLENNHLATDVIVGPAVLGEWMLGGNCDHLILDIQAGQLKELSREWIITGIHDDKITLVYEEGTLRMEMRLRKGEPEVPTKCLELIDYLVQGKWTVGKFTDENEANKQFDGYRFKFKEDGGFISYNNDQEITGQWHPSKSCDYIVIELDRNSSAGALSGLWKIEHFNDNGITLVYEKMSKKKIVELIRA